jgi:hypothetical protein
LVATTTPPAFRIPKNAITNCGEFGMKMPTRSPFFTPISTNPAATRSVIAFISL